jgi:hypothetical protein
LTWRAVQRLQQFAFEHKLLDKPVFGKLESSASGAGIVFLPRGKCLKT